MPRSTEVLAGVLLPVAVVAALSGCSSSGDDKKPADKATEATVPAAPAASASASSSQDAGGTHGRLDYTGSLSGGFDVTAGVGCRILFGELEAVTSPDADEPDGSGFAAPSFDATTGHVSVVTLITPDGHTFERVGAKGVSAAKQGDVWTVTISGAELRAADSSGGSVTVNGHLTCTKVHGTEAP